jgi:hypothetical protein
MRSGYMTSKLSLCGVLPDMHIPQENKAAVTWAIRTLQAAGITRLILLGDVINLDAVSRFLKTPEQAARLPEELLQGRRFIQRLLKAFPGLPVTYLLGNHEERLTKYICKNAPALLDLPSISFRELMVVPKSWQVVPYGSFVFEQGVLVQHGTRWGHATCRQNLALGCSSIQGHSHRARVELHRLANGTQLAACEMGCLCDFDQGYSKLNDWTHACGLIQGGHINLITRDGHGKR